MDAATSFPSTDGNKRSNARAYYPYDSVPTGLLVQSYIIRKRKGETLKEKRMTRTEMIEQLEKENPEMKIRIFDKDGDMLCDTTVQDQLDEARGLDDEAFGEATYQEICEEYRIYAVEQESRLGGGVILTKPIKTKEEALVIAREYFDYLTERDFDDLTEIEKEVERINVNTYRTVVPFETFDFDESWWVLEESEEVKEGRR